MNDFTPKITLLVRQGLENVETLPFITKGLQYVDSGEYIPVQYRKPFYKFLNDFFGVALNDPTIFRLIRTRVSALMGAKHRKEEVNMSEFTLVEKYLGFKKLKASIAAKGGTSNPGAVAAAIGMKKYGKKKFEKAAHSGHKLGEETLAEKKHHGKHIGFDGLVKKLMAQGKSRHYAEAIAGKVNAEKHGDFHKEETDLQENSKRGLAKQLQTARQIDQQNAKKTSTKTLNVNLGGIIKRPPKINSGLSKFGKTIWTQRARGWRKELNKRLNKEETIQENSRAKKETERRQSISDVLKTFSSNDALKHARVSLRDERSKTTKHSNPMVARLSRREYRRRINNEETDLQELSKDKISAYVDKATKDNVMTHSSIVQADKRGVSPKNELYKEFVRTSEKRTKHIQQAKKKLGEETQLDEHVDLHSASDATLHALAGVPGKKRAAGSKPSSHELRLASMAKAELWKRAHKTQKEEVELSELSHETQQKYFKAALKDRRNIIKSSRHIEPPIETPSQTMPSHLHKRLEKREKGMKTSLQKLMKHATINKEETDITELKKTTLTSYKEKAEKSADKLWDKADKEEKKSPEKAKKTLEKWGKRTVGIETAQDKLKEEINVSDYKDRFATALKKFGITDISLLDEDEMKVFLEYVDTQNEAVISAANSPHMPLSPEMKAQIAADMAKRKEKKDKLVDAAKGEYDARPKMSYKDMRKAFPKRKKTERTD